MWIFSISNPYWEVLRAEKQKFSTLYFGLSAGWCEILRVLENKPYIVKLINALWGLETNSHLFLPCSFPLSNLWALTVSDLFWVTLKTLQYPIFKRNWWVWIFSFWISQHARASLNRSQKTFNKDLVMVSMMRWIFLDLLTFCITKYRLNPCPSS